MALFDQFSALFRLPGARARARQSSQQATRVSSLANAAIGSRLPTPQPAAIGPAVTKPATPAPLPARPQQNAQIGSINALLGNLTTGLQGISKALPGIESSAKTTALQDQYAPIESELLASAAPSAEEQDIKKKLSSLIASKNLGLLESESRPVPLQAILGEQSKIERRAAIEQGTLQDQLTQLQAAREGTRESAKLRLEIAKERSERAKPDEEKLDTFVNEAGEQVVSFRNKKTNAIRTEVLGKAQPKAGTQTDRDRALKTGAIGVARPLLIKSRGTDGYVDPATYLKLRSDYAEAIGNPADFDKTFSPMLAPTKRKELGVGSFSAAAEDIGSILASYLSQ